MKIYGIFRGFAGLGRVVSGMALIERFRADGHEVRVFTYAQGLSVAKEEGLPCLPVKGTKDIGFMGLVPISPTGLSVIDEILAWQPDVILVDGEPLMISCLRAAGVKGKIIALVNTTDLYSPTNHPVTMNFFRHLFCQSDLVLCHGLQNIEDHVPKEFQRKVVCLHTIFRQAILKIRRERSKDVICILGGGTKNCAQDFVDSTVEIGQRVLLLAQKRPKIKFRIYCNDEVIAERIQNEFNVLPNVQIIASYASPCDMYENAAIVIARAGRNTLSELLYLKIPAIVIPILRNVVSIEQNRNVQIVSNLSNGRIIGYDLRSNPTDIIEAFERVCRQKDQPYDTWDSGNDEAYRRICACATATASKNSVG